MKKVPFFPLLGALSGAACVVSGFVTGIGARGIADSVSTPAANYSDSYDIFSYYFGGTQSSATDTGAVMTAKLAEICGKGFGLLLIFLGLFMICCFGWKIEKALKEAHTEGFVPEWDGQDMPPQDMPQDIPQQNMQDVPAQDYAQGMPQQDFDPQQNGPTA